MRTSTAIPCKRPKVTIETVRTYPAGSGGEGYAAPLSTRIKATCQVPGCTWAYDNVVKSDVQEQAARHRAGHRAAVPNAYLEHDIEWDVYCEPCGGHRRTLGTRADAQAWLDYHLSAEHGLVTCP